MTPLPAVFATAAKAVPAPYSVLLDVTDDRGRTHGVFLPPSVSKRLRRQNPEPLPLPQGKFNPRKSYRSSRNLRTTQSGPPA